MLTACAESQRLEPMAAVAAVVGNNSNGGSGVNGGGDECSCGDGECNGSSSRNGDSHGSGEVTKTTAATAMAVGEIQQSTEKGMTKTAMATEMATMTNSVVPC